MVKYVLPIVAVLLFLVEPEFAMFSPLNVGDYSFILVPHFLILYLIFLAIYYSRKKALIYGLIVGIFYDVVYIDILGLYTVLFPALCFIASWCVKYIHQRLFITTILSVLLVAIMEFAMYEFYVIVDITTMELMPFLFYRLVPTIIANLLYLFLLGWIFKLLIDTRLIEQERNMA